MTDVQTKNIYYGTAKKNLSGYLIGYVLCIILTLIPFAVVMYGTLSDHGVLAIIFTAAIIQLFVQVMFFLRLHVRDTASKMNVMVFLFTILILAVIAGGSLWIMWSLNYNMIH